MPISAPVDMIHCISLILQIKSTTLRTDQPTRGQSIETIHIFLCSLAQDPF